MFGHLTNQRINKYELMQEGICILTFYFQWLIIFTSGLTNVREVIVTLYIWQAGRQAVWQSDEILVDLKIFKILYRLHC